MDMTGRGSLYPVRIRPFHYLLAGTRRRHDEKESGLALRDGSSVSDVSTDHASRHPVLWSHQQAAGSCRPCPRDRGASGANRTAGGTPSSSHHAVSGLSFAPAPAQPTHPHASAQATWPLAFANRAPLFREGNGLSADDSARVCWELDDCIRETRPSFGAARARGTDVAILWRVLRVDAWPGSALYGLETPP